MSRVGNPGTLGAIALGDQDWFKQLFEFSPDPTWIIANNVFVECNEAAVRTLGYPNREELANVHPSRLSPPTQPDGEDSYVKAQRMMALAKNNGLHRFEWTHTKADGTDFVAEVTLSAIELSGQQVIYCVWRDITDRKQTETALHASEAQFRAIFEQAAVGISHVALDGRWLHVNQKLCDITGYTREELLTHRYQDITHPDDLANNQELERHLLTDEVPTYSIEKRYLHKSGRILWVRPTVSVVYKDSGEPDYFISVIEDITERKQVEAALRESEERWKFAIEGAGDGIWDWNVPQSTVFFSKRWKEMLGFTPDEIGTGLDEWSKRVHPDDMARVMAEVQAHLDGKTATYVNEHRVSCKDGSSKWILDRGLVISRDAEGKPLRMIGTHADITNHKKAEEEIRSLAYSDSLTSLPNRRLMMDRLEQAMVSALRHGHQNALLFVDMDDFKTLNDSLGHDKGDQLLQQIAGRVLTCVREGDTVARLGGDEFVMLLEDLDKSPQEAAKQAEVVARKIHNALRQPYQLDSHGYHSSASIGITLFGGAQRESIEEPLKRAELAMYKAKAVGRDNLRFFEPEMRNAINARASLEADLHEALTKGQFIVYYQAQGGDENRISGVEALVRWQHPERGLISPTEFIPVAEANGLILPLGHWVLETACKQLAAWALRPEMAKLTISVNVSARQFRLPIFVAEVLAILEASGANPKRLKLELTESLLLDNMQDIITKMNALKSSGVGFSLDDFGTGYSSLSYLKRLPLDELKIDKGFVKDILTDPNDAAIAKMVVALADSMGLAVIAEGVETQAQRDALAALGCYAYQGYLFSRPLPIDEFEAFARGA